MYHPTIREPFDLPRKVAFESLVPLGQAYFPSSCVYLPIALTAVLIAFPVLYVRKYRLNRNRNQLRIFLFSHVQRKNFSHHLSFYKNILLMP